MTNRHGTTLIELMVVIALLGTIAGLAGVAFRRPSPPPAPSLAQRVSDARRQAERSGTAVALVVQDSGGSAAVRVLPDGRVLVEAPVSLDAVIRGAVDAPR